MKKILLSLLALVALAVNAQTTFTWTYQDWTGVTLDNSGSSPVVKGSDEISYQKDGFGIVVKKNSGTTAPLVFYGGNDGTVNDLRMYAKATCAISYTSNITGLEFAISTQGKKRLADVTATSGKVTVDAKNWKVYWVGDASSVTFTVGDKATYGTDGATKAGQFDFDNVILYVGGATPNVPVSDLQPSGLAYSQGSKTITIGTEYELPTLSNPNNLAVTYSSTKPEVATINDKGEVTIVAAGTCTIKAESEATDKFLAGKASYSLTVKEAEPVVEPQDEVELPYEENLTSSLGSFSIEDKTIPEGITYVWASASGYTKAAAYYNSTNYAAESWLVSPVIKLGSAAKPTVAFSHCITKYFGDVTKEATVWIKENNGSWNQLEITYPDFEGKSGSYSNWEDVTVDISSYAGKNVVVGFKYASTSEHAGTWEVKKFSVKDATAASINSVSSDATNSSAYNLAGQRVSSNYKGAVIKNGKKFMVK